GRDGDSIQRFQHTTHILQLPGWGGRHSPGHVIKIEKLRHITLRGIACGKAREIKTGLDQLQHRGVVHHRVRHIVLLRERGDDEERYTITGEEEPAYRVAAVPVADVVAVSAARQITRL